MNFYNIHVAISRYLLIFGLVGIFHFLALAQVPPSFMIQGLAQDFDGLPLIEQDVNIAVTLDGVPLDHDAVVTTSSAGVFKVEVSSVDIFELLKTGTGFLEVTVDGIPLATPLVSVPYAMIAEEAINDQVDDEDADPTNELQELSFSDGMLSITGGNEIAIPTGETDEDADPTNEFQTLALNGNVLSITDGNEVTIPTGGTDADADPTNELQTLALNGNVLSITDGNEVTIPTGGTDADADPTNEFQTLALNGNVLSISDGNEVTIPMGGTDADADPTNELQELSLNGNVLSIVGPGEGNATITLPEGGGGDSPWTQEGNNISYSDGQVIVKHNNSNSAVLDADDRNGRLALFDDKDRVVATMISDGTRNDPQGSFGYLELFGPNGGTNVILGFVGTSTEQDRGGMGLYNESDQAWWMSPGASNDPDLGLYYLNGNNFSKVGEFSRTNGNYSALSDLRAKGNIRTLPSLLNRVQNLRAVSYHYNHDPLKRKDIGFIAQEVKNLFPELVNDMDGRYGLNYDGFSVLAIKCVQELAAEKGQLEKELAETNDVLQQQRELIDNLVKRVNNLENANQ